MRIQSHVLHALDDMRLRRNGFELRVRNRGPILRIGPTLGCVVEDLLQVRFPARQIHFQID